MKSEQKELTQKAIRAEIEGHFEEAAALWSRAAQTAKAFDDPDGERFGYYADVAVRKAVETLDAKVVAIMSGLDEDLCQRLHKAGALRGCEP